MRLCSPARMRLPSDSSEFMYSTRIPFFMSSIPIFSAYSSWALATGSNATWTGVSHNGKCPAQCSMKMLMKRSRDPMMAQWIMTMRSFSPPSLMQ